MLIRSGIWHLSISRSVLSHCLICIERCPVEEAAIALTLIDLMTGGIVILVPIVIVSISHYICEIVGSDWGPSDRPHWLRY